MNTQAQFSSEMIEHIEQVKRISRRNELSRRIKKGNFIIIHKDWNEKNQPTESEVISRV